MDTDPGLGTSVEAAEDGYILHPGEVLRTLWKRLWIILLVTVVFTIAAVGTSLAQTPIYETSIKILVGQERGVTETPPADVGSLQQLTQTMAEGIKSRPIAEAVTQDLDMQMVPEDLLGEALIVKPIPDTQFIQVSYRDPNPQRAQQVANTVGDVFSERIDEVSPSASAITATVWERAVTPAEPVSPQPGRNGLLALALGLVLGTVLAVLLEFLDDIWRSPEEAERISGVPTFGVIPEFEASPGKKKGGK